MPIPIVIFAQVPPPEHGQSRMVSLAVKTLRERPEDFEIHHINTKFSSSLDDIGESTFGKLGLAICYLAQAISQRGLTTRPLLYYVPGPVKWSSVLRDWALLGVLRPFYPRVVFHWHAIGHGEWAHGSERISLDGPRWMDRLARKISARILDAPFASIAVSENSQADSRAVGSQRELVIHNGIEDPCSGFGYGKGIPKGAGLRGLRPEHPTEFRILFLSHGTIEKGALDALACMGCALEQSDPSWKFQITFVGGISEAIDARFHHKVNELLLQWPERLRIEERGYLTGESKQDCFLTHDVFLAPSRWESFGLTVIEAMAHSLPVVAAASDGVRGVLPAGYPYLSPVAEPQPLASNLLSCCTELGQPSSLKLGRALRERYLSLYQLKDFSDHLISAFLELGDATKPVLPTPKLVGRKHNSGSPTETPNLLPPETPTLHISAYLADQNPGYDRSFGISRMTQVVLETLQAQPGIDIEVIVSETSQQAPASIHSVRSLPWGTRRKLVRLFTDHIHPLFSLRGRSAGLYYFPKGYLPLLGEFCHPSAVTIHDTIIQYDSDHYPSWRNRLEYGYWAMMLKHTLREADAILTVSETSKGQIESFMDRHGIPSKPIKVTYEPCLYEHIPQPLEPGKGDYVIHLSSCEPHKRTAHLIRWWHAAQATGRHLPTLHLIGNAPPEVTGLLKGSKGIVKRPFLDDRELQEAYRGARALILPSEIEGFGLPALEAYYLGTPVCFVRQTSVEEVLAPATGKGGFTLDEPESLFAALDGVMAMGVGEIRNCGLTLRETYAAEKVADRMLEVFHRLVGR